MTGIAIIGNSHLVAVKEGWSAVRSPFTPTWFGSGTNRFANLVVENGRITTHDRNTRMYLELTSGRNDIDPAEFSAFLLVGLHLRGIRMALEIYETHRMHVHAGPEHHLVSRSVLLAAMAGNMRVSAAFIMANTLRTLTDAPIVVVPEPLPASGGKKGGAALHEILLALQDCANEAMRSLFAPGIELVMQPAHTIEEPCFTRAEYSAGARSFQGEEITDRYHKNAAYGTAVLEAALPHLGSKHYHSASGVAETVPAGS